MGGQLGKVDGAWPVLPSVCMDDDEPKTVPVSKAVTLLQVVCKGYTRDGPETSRDATMISVSEASVLMQASSLQFPSCRCASAWRKNSEQCTELSCCGRALFLVKKQQYQLSIPLPGRQRLNKD